MIQCKVCGTTTGQHGFSFDDKAMVTQAAERKRNGGILLIPREMLPEGVDPEEFLSEIRDSLTQDCAPEVRWKDSDILNRSASDRW